MRDCTLVHKLFHVGKENAVARNSVYCNVLLALLASVASPLPGSVLAQVPDKLPQAPD